MRLWGSEGQPLAVLEGHTDGVWGALALADGRFLSWSKDYTMRLWGSEGQPLAVLEGHTDWVQDALALADGRFLSWSKDYTMRLWGSEGQPLAVLEGHTDRVQDALSLADGRFLSWSADTTHRLWGPEGQPLHKWTWDEVPTELLTLLADSDTPHPPICQNIALISEGKDVFAGPVHWQSDADIGAFALVPDGTAVITLDSGHLFCLKLYQGNERVTLEALKADLSWKKRE
jgi:WD40 repeat protein